MQQKSRVEYFYDVIALYGKACSMLWSQHPIRVGDRSTTGYGPLRHLIAYRDEN